MGIVQNLFLLLLVVAVHTQDDGTADAEAALVDNNTSQTTTPTKSEEPTDFICRSCVCKDGLVDCSNQDIEKPFEKKDWSGLVKLKPKIVDLSNNPLSSLTQLVELPIENLNLSHCNIDNIVQAAFKDLQRMKVLDLSYNKLTTEKLSPHIFEGRYSPERYEPLSSMRILSLAHNELHSLNQDLFEHLPDLTELDLSGNPLTTIDHVSLIAISSLPMLKVLKMRSCQLKEIPEKFLHTPRYLERLDLSDNLLTEVPQELEETKNLLYLNLNQNPIVKIEKNSEDYTAFPKLLKLQELHMCNMDKLEKIDDGALGGLENLQSLHLSFNSKLSYIHPKALARIDENGEIYDWPPIRILYLQSNNLTEVDRRFLSRWDLVEEIDVTNNPYLCDCSTQWMVDVLVNVVERLHENTSTEMICQEPIEMRGFTMKKLHDGHHTMRCVDKYGNRPEKDGAILLGTLIGVLLAVPIVLTIILFWRKGYFSFCGMRGPADYSRAFYKRAQSEDFVY